MGPDAKSEQSDVGTPETLGWVFVGMLFALAVSQIAILVSAWFRTPGRFGPASFPALAHLVVTLCLVSASWVGWSRSQASDTAATGNAMHPPDMPNTAIATKTATMAICVDRRSLRNRFSMPFASSGAASEHLSAARLHCDGSRRSALCAQPGQAGRDTRNSVQPGRIHLDRASMAAYHGLHDIEAEAGPLADRFRGEERVEDPAAILL